MSRRIIDLIQFGYITATKNLIKAMKKRGVPVKRGDFQSALTLKGGRREIEITRTPEAYGAMKAPIADLFHEAGHEVTKWRGRSALNNRPYLARASTASGIERQQAERRANRAGIKLMNKMGGTDQMRDSFRRSSAAAYETYLPSKTYREMYGAKGIVEDAFALSALSALIRFERVENPIFRKGVRPGTHHIGEGKERMVRVHRIVSPQYDIDEGKVRKMTGKKSLPSPTLSHLGHGVYVVKDGNHRVNAALRAGKRKILAKIQRM